MLLRQDLDGSEVGVKTGAAEFVGLLIGVALGDENEAVTGGEVGEGFGDVGEEFDLLLGDGLCEADDAIVLFGCDGCVAELLETVNEGTAETAEPVAVSLDGGVLAVVE